MAGDDDWDTPLETGSVPSGAAASPDDWGTPLDTSNAPKAPSGPKQTEGLRRLEMIPEALATGAQNLTGLPGSLQDLANKYLPNALTRPISSYFDPSVPTTPQHIFPTGSEIAKSTGLGLENRPDLTPQNAFERYGVAATEAIPSAALVAMTGGASALGSLATTEGGALSAQAAADAAPGNKWLPVVAGIVGSLGAGGVSSWVEKTLDGKQAIQDLADRQAELDSAVVEANSAKNPATRNDLAIKDANALEAQQAAQAAENIKSASQARLDSVQALADKTTQAAEEATGQTFQNTAQMIGKSKTVEDAGKALQAQARGWLDGPASQPGTMAAKLKAVSDPLEAAVPGETPVDLTNFSAALGSINKKAGSLQGLADELNSGLPARLQKALDARTGAGEAAGDLADLTGGEVPVAGGPPTWNDVRTIRTMLGDAMKDPTAVKGISQQQLGYLYKALTNDLGSAATNVGAGDLWNAYNTEASRLYGVAQGVMSKITTTGREGISPGKMASSLLRAGRNDSGDLAAIRQEIPQGADELAAAHLRQGPDAWGKLLPASQQALVPSTETTSVGVLNSALESQAKAAANAQATVESAAAEHEATVAQAQADLKAGNFARSRALQEAQRARAQASYDSAQKIAGLKQGVEEAQARVPASPTPITNFTNALNRWGSAALGIAEGPWILNHLGIHTSPEAAAAIGLGTLGAPLVGQAVKAAVKNPATLTVPLTGAVAGQNALAVPAAR